MLQSDRNIGTKILQNSHEISVKALFHFYKFWYFK